MTAHFVLAGLAVLAIATAPEAHTAEGTRGCPRGPALFPDAPEVVYLIDARVADADSVRRVDVTRIASVEVICARGLYDMFEVKAAKAGIVMFTAPGPRKELEAALDSLVSLQQTHLAKHGAFAHSLAELGWADDAGLISVELSVDETRTRWSAIGTHRYIRGEARTKTVGGERTPPPNAHDE